MECFHCQLKAVFRASSNSQHWTKSLPMVLLGIQTSVKEGSVFSPVGLLYGAPLSLPGQMLTLIDLSSQNLNLYVNILTAHMPAFRSYH